MSTPDQPTTAEIIKRARRLERLIARARRQRKKLEELDHEIATERRMLNELTRPFALDRGELPLEPAP